MRGPNTERRTSCTVTVELNRYGAMTLRSERGRTYQVVGTDERSSSGSRTKPGDSVEHGSTGSQRENHADDSDTPTITEQLAELRVDSQVSVTLQQAHGRGNTWWVTDIGSGPDTDRSTVWPHKR